MLGRVAAGEQPFHAGAFGLPIGPQQVEQLRREHDQARFATLAAGRHARAVDIVHAQSRRIEQKQPQFVLSDRCDYGWDFEWVQHPDTPVPEVADVAGGHHEPAHTRRRRQCCVVPVAVVFA